MTNAEDRVKGNRARTLHYKTGSKQRKKPDRHGSDKGLK